MPATQANRQVRVTTALGNDVLLFKSMRGSEGLGRLSTFTVQLVSINGAIATRDVLGKPLTVAVDISQGSDVRFFNGIVTRFSSIGWSNGLATYEAVVHPWLWLLQLSSNCRIFQDMTVVDIVIKVCANYGGGSSLSTSELSGDYPRLSYCVQYRETDFAFVLRLLDDAGIYFYFTHDSHKHTMVLADSYSAHAPIAGYAGLQFDATGQNRPREYETVSVWESGGAIGSSKYVLDDFDFENAGASLSGGLRSTASIAAAFDQTAFEMFDYPGKYNVARDGSSLVRARMERLHGQCEQIAARTDARGLSPGGLFTLIEHPRDDQNRDYLVISAQYSITGGDYSSGDGAAAFQFVCDLNAVGKEHAFRPVCVVQKPIVQGPQTAMVVGKAGEEIWTDKYGRIKVQFHWDREGKSDEHSSCWVRVAQGWAGKNWGAMTLPRIGMEVVVSFLEGDPDRPLVTGCVYNSDAMPPYPLPEHQSRSTVKTNSTKGGGGFNEVRFEDKKGKEEIFVQAERDFNRVVKNNDKLMVGHEVADKGDQTIDIKNDQDLTIGHDQIVKIKNDQNTTISNDQILAVSNNQTMKIDGKQEVKVGSSSAFTANESFTITVGGSSIKLEPGKITIKSPQIDILADGMMKIKAGAIVTIEGAMVKIN